MLATTGPSGNETSRALPSSDQTTQYLLDQHEQYARPTSYPDETPSVLSSADHTVPSTPTGLDQLDGFFTSSLCFSLLNTPDVDGLTGYHFHPGSLDAFLEPTDVISFSPSESVDVAINDALPDRAHLADSQALSGSRPPTTSEPQRTPDLPSQSPSHCLSHVLNLLQRLSPNAHISCTISRGQSNNDKPGQLPTFRSVIVENTSMIETITSVLQCPCSQDQYVLSIIALTVFKVLGWYAAAAAAIETSTPDNCDPDSSALHSGFQGGQSEQVQMSPAVIGGYRVCGEDQSRMARQLVLSELHRVQRLVNLLSERLTSPEMSSSPSGTVPPAAVGSSDLRPDREAAFSFPVTLLSQLETDMRHRLRALSNQIVEMLRRA